MRVARADDHDSGDDHQAHREQRARPAPVEPRLAAELHHVTLAVLLAASG